VKATAAIFFAFVLVGAEHQAGELTLFEKMVRWPHVDLAGALHTNDLGYPILDKNKLDLKRVTTSEFKAIALENAYVRVTLLPGMGRVVSLFDKIAGREVLWTNQIARPLVGQQNQLEWWMVWGGVEYTIPAGEHGTTWALPWRYEISENSAERKAVRMTVLEPKTRLEQTVELALPRNYAGYQANMSVRNTSDKTVRFSHWVNPMWAPGGRGELTPKTEFIVPTAEMYVPPRDFNNWMLGERVQSWADNPLRFIESWRSIGDLLAVELTNGFYAAFSHDTDHGVARIFDHKANPGMDIWTWGFQPAPELQREYSLTPNAGYVEMWGGSVRDFTEASLQPIGPGEVVRFVEWMAPFRGTKGLTSASHDLAVLFSFSDVERSRVELAICPLRPVPGAAIEVRTAAGRNLFSEKTDLKPEVVFQRAVPLASGGRADLSLVIASNSKVIFQSQAVPRVPTGVNASSQPKAPGEQRAIPAALEPARPKIQKLGTVDLDLVETTPVVLSNRLWRFEWIRQQYWNNQRKTNFFRFRDVSTGEVTPPFAEGHEFGSAFVHDGKAYVTGTQMRSAINMFASTDLKNWEQWEVLNNRKYSIFNTSLCRTDTDFVLMFEFDNPKEEAGVPFTARFARSKDLRQWTITPPECQYSKERYTAPHALRWLDGWFYNFFLEAHQGYEMRVVRSRDLISWEPSRYNPVLRFSDEDKLIRNQSLSAEQRQQIKDAVNLNNSDIDFCDWDGKTFITYSWGNQQGEEFLGEAIYNGSVESFLRAWFPSPNR
jgi:hypothetical protein